MSAVCERSVQLNAEISWLSREGQDATFGNNLKLTSCLLVVQVEAAVTVLLVLSFSFDFCKYDDEVAVSCVRIPSTDCQFSGECMMAW